MKTKARIILFLLFFFNFVCMGQVFTTSISEIRINNIKVVKPVLSNISVPAGQSVEFYFSNDIPPDAAGETFYMVFLNNKLLIEKLSSNYIALHGLAAGSYKLRVQAINGTSYEALSVEKSFDVIKKESASASSSSGSVDFSTLDYLLVGTILLLAVAVIILSLRLKSSPKASPAVKADILDGQVSDDVEKLKESHQIIKRAFKKSEDENKRLKKITSSLNKTVQSLEEANVSLIEQKEALQVKKLKLEDLQKQKDELLAIKFHDIKNPANAIQGLVELLEDYNLTANEQQEIMESIVRSSNNIVNLVQDISETFAKESFDDEYIMDTAALQDVIRSVVSINSAYAKKKSIRLLNNSTQSMPEFKFDAVKIKEAIDNLVNNAVKFSPESTDVVIRTYLTDKFAVFEIKDNGVGMSTADVVRAFEKGAKLTPQPTGGEKSSGLGLWIVKKIIEQGHKGEVTLDSKEGVGTTFTVKLPFNSPEMPAV